jgi:hypothetical protein
MGSIPNQFIVQLFSLKKNIRIMKIMISQISIVQS